MATLEIKTAEELTDPALEARWSSRRAARETAVFQRILRSFVERGGPVPIRDIMLALRDRSIEEIRDALSALDGDDLIRVREGHVDIAYPFSAAPTLFVVRLPDGTDRYACCAIDALGVAPLLGQHVHIRARCHDCNTPLDFSAGSDAPGPEAAGVMVWVGQMAEDRGRVLDSL
jgi:hypothetical protein